MFFPAKIVIFIKYFKTVEKSPASTLRAKYPVLLSAPTNYLNMLN
jgi:hypothetical protein